MNKTDTSWSKLLHTEMGDYVRGRMSNGLFTYHNINHIERLYAKANEWGIPYDSSLDGAILWHDAVYDAAPDKEIRSAALVTECSQVAPEWFKHLDLAEINAQILSTVDHKITSDVRSTMIKLDIAELADPVRRRENFWAILQESINLYGTDVVTVCNGTYQFMDSFYQTMYANKLLLSEVDDQDFWDGVCEGCETVGLMASTIIDLYGFKHVST
jgi:predicted metal-dependent HD superfamily phosphohydrolase